MKIINRIKASDDFALTIKKAKRSVTSRTSSITAQMNLNMLESVFLFLLN